MQLRNALPAAGWYGMSATAALVVIGRMKDGSADPVPLFYALGKFYDLDDVIDLFDLTSRRSFVPEGAALTAHQKSRELFDRIIEVRRWDHLLKLRQRYANDTAARFRVVETLRDRATPPPHPRDVDFAITLVPGLKTLAVLDKFKRHGITAEELRRFLDACELARVRRNDNHFTRQRKLYT